MRPSTNVAGRESEQHREAEQHQALRLEHERDVGSDPEVRLAQPGRPGHGPEHPTRLSQVGGPEEDPAEDDEEEGHRPTRRAMNRSDRARPVARSMMRSAPW